MICLYNSHTIDNNFQGSIVREIFLEHIVNQYRKPVIFVWLIVMV